MPDRKMEQRDQLLGKLLEKSCYVIDFLPERVPETSSGQFFDVEYYLLNSYKHDALKDKFVGVILKLMCYYHIVISWNGWIDRPEPEMIDHAIDQIMNNHSGTLNVLFPEEEALLVFEWDCLNLSVYNPGEKMKTMMDRIALSEGLFWWKGLE